MTRFSMVTAAALREYIFFASTPPYPEQRLVRAVARDNHIFKISTDIKRCKLLL